MSTVNYSGLREQTYRIALQEVRRAIEQGASSITVLHLINMGLERGQALIDAEFPVPFERVKA